MTLPNLKPIFYKLFLIQTPKLPSRILYYSNTQDNAAATLAYAMLDYADKHLMFDRAVTDIDLVLSDERYSSTYLNRIVRKALDERQ